MGVTGSEEELVHVDAIKEMKSRDHEVKSKMEGKFNVAKKKITSFNVRGYGNINKQKHLQQLIKSSMFDVCLLEEADL